MVRYLVYVWDGCAGGAKTQQEGATRAFLQKRTFHAITAGFTGDLTLRLRLGFP